MFTERAESLCICTVVRGKTYGCNPGLIRADSKKLLSINRAIDDVKCQVHKLRQTAWRQKKFDYIVRSHVTGLLLTRLLYSLAECEIKAHSEFVRDFDP